MSLKFQHRRVSLSSTTSPLKVLILGSNPGCASPDATAFHPDSRSRKVLDAWCQGIDAKFSYANVSDEKTEGNRPLSGKALKEAVAGLPARIASYEPTHVVAVGATAGKALAKIGHPKFLVISHPSGRDRKLNDPKHVEEIKRSLREFIR